MTISFNLTLFFKEPCPDGTFLLRNSHSEYGFSLTIAVPGTIKHYKIDCFELGEYEVTGKPVAFSGINNLISYYAETALSQTDKQLLKHVCLRR